MTHRPIFPIRSSFHTVALAIAAAAVLSACGEEKQAASSPPPAPPVVTVVTMQHQSVPIINELPGRTTPSKIAEVRPQVTGIVTERPFNEGSEVTAGQVLYVIDASTYQANYESAEAEVARAQTEARIEELKAERYADLVEQKFISKQAYDEVAATARQAAAAAANAEAAARRAKIDVEYAKVKAPISGRIGRSTVTPGALVTANQATALATVQQLDPIYVDLTQSSVQMLRLRQAFEDGRLQKRADDTVPVTLQLEDGTSYKHEGRLAFSEVTVERDTGSVTLRAIFPNPDGNLLPGMYVRAQLEQGMLDNAVLVPQAAVSRDPRGNAQVMVVNADNIVEVRRVTTPRVIGDEWIVTEGLSAGDRVIVSGLQRARAGSPVTPQTPDEAAQAQGGDAVAKDATEKPASAQPADTKTEDSAGAKDGASVSASGDAPAAN